MRPTFMCSELVSHGNIRKMASKCGEVSGALVSAYQDLERYKHFC